MEEKNINLKEATIEMIAKFEELDVSNSETAFTEWTMFVKDEGKYKLFLYFDGDISKFETLWKVKEIDFSNEDNMTNVLDCGFTVFRRRHSGEYYIALEKPGKDIIEKNFIPLYEKFFK